MSLVLLSVYAMHDGSKRFQFLYAMWNYLQTRARLVRIEIRLFVCQRAWNINPQVVT